MSEETRHCEHCNQTLAGRIDKRFCSDQCRAMAHNRQRQKNQGEQMVRGSHSAGQHLHLLLRLRLPAAA